MLNRSAQILAMLVLCLMVPVGSLAQSYSAFPQTGILAAQGNLPATGSLAINQLPMGMNGVPVPLLGSISRQNKNWEFQVSNQTDRTIKASVELLQFAPGPKLLASQTKSYKLKPKAIEGGSIPAKEKVVGAAVKLKSWAFVD